MLLNKPPLYIAGGAAYPYSQSLLDRMEVETRFGEVYNLARPHPEDDTLWVPRRCAPEPADDRRVDGERVAYEHRFIPRSDEQAQISAQGAALLLSGASFIIQAPTGWGKTVVGCSIAAQVKRKTMVITTKEDILEQWAKAARDVLGLSGKDIDLWRGDTEPAHDAKFVVGLVQSLAKGPERYPDVDFASFGLVIADEVHRLGADHFSQCMWGFPAKLRLGLSATPYRKDGREQVFLSHIGPVILTAKQETLIPRIVIRHSDWRVPRQRRWDSERCMYVIGQMPHEAGKLGHVSKMLSRYHPRNEMIVRFLQAALAKRRNTVVFSDNLAHLDRIHELLLLRGVPDEDIGYYVGIRGRAYTGTKKERQVQRERAKVRRIVLATYQMASEATDVPWWDTCVLAIPRADVIQIVGRIRREYPGKTTPVVLDIIDGDSPVYTQFARSRLGWYESLGCEIRAKS